MRENIFLVYCWKEFYGFMVHMKVSDLLTQNREWVRAVTVIPVFFKWIVFFYKIYL